MSYHFSRIVPSVRHALQEFCSCKKFGLNISARRVPFHLLPNIPSRKCICKLSPQSRTFTTSSTFWNNASNPTQSGGSLCRQNFHQECEANINKQINLELYASYVYMAMAYYFNRDDVAFPGFYKYFKESSDEEREHAEKLMKYQNKRGGRIVLQNIAKPYQEAWTSPLEAVSVALELEKTVNQALLDLHSISGQHKDAHLSDFLEEHFLEGQVDDIKELADMVTRLKRVGSGLGEYIFDEDLDHDKG